MASILILSGSPSPTSSTAGVAAHIAAQLRDHRVRTVLVRDLPPVPLLRGEARHPAVGPVIDQIEATDAVILVSPVRKSSCSGLLKSLLDLLPPSALKGKAVLPVATGHIPAHALTLENTLRLMGRLGARAVLPVWFIRDQQANQLTPLNEHPLHLLERLVAHPTTRSQFVRTAVAPPPTRLAAIPS